MPRPQKSSVDWFPHPVTHGRKMGLLERKFGNNGYAVWFKMLEEIGSAPLHTISLRDEVQIELYSSRCLVDQTVFMQILDDLIRWGEFNQMLWESRRVLYSAKFIESVSVIYSKRQCVKPSVAAVLANFEPIKPSADGQQPELTTPAPRPARTSAHSASDMPIIKTYEDLFRHPPIIAAQALTGDTSKRAYNTWKKYLRELSSEDPERGESMFRDMLSVLFGEIKAEEIKNPAAVLTKRLKELL